MFLHLAPAGKPHLRVETDRVDHDLQVGPLEMVSGADHHVAAVDLTGHGALAGQRPADRIECDPVEPQLVEEGHRFPGIPFERRGRMLLQVAADALAVMDDFDAVLLKMHGRSDARQHQKMRRVIGPAGKYHFAPGADLLRPRGRVDLDADAFLAVEHDAAHQDAGANGEILPSARRAEIGCRGADAPPPCIDRLLAAGKAFSLFARQIVRFGKASRLCGRHHLVMQEMRRIDRPDRHGPAGAMPGALAPPAVLQLAEIRQHVRKGPAARAHLRPLIVILGMTAHGEHAVDRARTAHHPPARQRHFSAAEMGLRLGPVGPVELGMRHRLEEGERHLQEDVIVLPTSLEQQDIGPGVFAQPRSHDTACTARAHHDIVENLFCHSRSPSRLANVRYNRRQFVSGEAAYDPRRLRSLRRRIQRPRL